MELDSLKDLWKDQDSTIAYHDDDEQIMSMLRKRSQSPIAKMRRNLRWELVAVIVIYSFTISYLVTSWHGIYWENALLLLIVGLLFVFYYYHKNKLLKAMQCLACEVRSNLQKQLTTLEKYVRFYFISATILTPVAYFVAGLVIFSKTPSRRFGDEPLATRAQPMLHYFSEHSYFAEFVIMGIVLGGGTYFFNRWYLNKLYGQHIKRLKELLRQMDDIEG